MMLTNLHEKLKPDIHVDPFLVSLSFWVGQLISYHGIKAQVAGSHEFESLPVYLSN